MKHLKLFLYGLLIGLSNLIPGFSGGTMALILGIFEWFTSSISLITKDFKKAFINLWSCGIGIILGLVLGTLIVSIALEKAPMITASFFVGLVCATLYLAISELKAEKVKASEIITLVITFSISCSLPFLSNFGIIINLNEPSVFTIIYLFIVAILASATMIIPAASGSLILLVFGLYEPIINLLKDTLNMVITNSYSGFLLNIIIITIFIIGMVIGFIGISKLIELLFQKHKRIIWSSITGLILSSIFTIPINAYNMHIKEDITIITNHLVLNIVLSLVLFLIGFIGIFVIIKKINKTKEK